MMHSADSDSPSSRLRLYFACTTDPSSSVGGPIGGAYLVLSEMRDRASVELGRTEAVDFTGHARPPWKTSVEVVFKFEMRQDITVNLRSTIGVVATTQFQLGHVASARGGRYRCALGQFMLEVTSQVVQNVGLDTLSLRLSGSQLKQMNTFCGSTNPYFKLFRQQPNGSNLLLYRSAAITNTLEPRWPACPMLKLVDLCGGNLDAPCLIIECWCDNAFVDDFMGQCTVSVNQLISSIFTAPFTLKHSTKNKTFGNLHVDVAQINHVPTFLDYLAGGLQINVCVSIDFTSSNGDPNNSSSLHARGGTNQYVRALTSVCDVALEYDNDKLVPAFGFGAQLPSGQVSHCFHLNAQPDPNVEGLDGVLDAYRAALSAVKLSGPTNFAPSIRQAERAARNTPNTYTILLILTDGAITDTDATVDAIVACGDAPLSIVIVGVGSGDFSTMVMLDGDDERLVSTTGVRCARDLVQFVPYRDFANVPRAALAAEVLEEVPRQVEEWAEITRQPVSSATGPLQLRH